MSPSTEGINYVFYSLYHPLQPPCLLPGHRGSCRPAHLAPGRRPTWQRASAAGKPMNSGSPHQHSEGKDRPLRVYLSSQLLKVCICRGVVLSLSLFLSLSLKIPILSIITTTTATTTTIPFVITTTIVSTIITIFLPYGTLSLILYVIPHTRRITHLNTQTHEHHSSFLKVNHTDSITHPDTQQLLNSHCFSKALSLSHLTLPIHSDQTPMYPNQTFKPIHYCNMSLPLVFCVIRWSC